MNKLAGSLLTLLTISSSAFSAAKINCLEYLGTTSPSLHIKLSKKEMLDDTKIALINDYQTRIELKKARAEQIERLEAGFDFDLDIVLDRLTYRDVDYDSVEKEIGSTLIKATYDITPSSESDTDSSPFGVIALGTESGQISDVCSAQMASLSVDEETGDLYVNKKGKKTLIAKPLKVLPSADRLDELFGEYHEYAFIDGVSLKKASFIVKERRSYSFKKMNLSIKKQDTRSLINMSSFRD